MKNNILTSLIAFLWILSFSCCDDKNEAEDIQANLVGTWQLTSVQIDGVSVDIAAHPGFIRLQENKIFLSYHAATQVLIRGGWSYEGNMLNISTDLPVAYYVLKADGKTLSLKRQDFNADGKLSTTIRDYQRTADSQIPE
ncbi:MAG: lipocalin family protein [Dysgonamonadaceae bacterium]|nr:lipocalin family protein [Dysgonamonadaceae bacterium]